jgi:hypothetical protein
MNLPCHIEGHRRGRERSRRQVATRAGTPPKRPKA